MPAGLAKWPRGGQATGRERGCHLLGVLSSQPLSGLPGPCPGCPEGVVLRVSENQAPPGWATAELCDPDEFPDPAEPPGWWGRGVDAGEAAPPAWTRSPEQRAPRCPQQPPRLPAPLHRGGHRDLPHHPREASKWQVDWCTAPRVADGAGATPSASCHSLTEPQTALLVSVCWAGRGLKNLGIFSGLQLQTSLFY